MGFVPGRLIVHQAREEYKTKLPQEMKKMLEDILKELGQQLRIDELRERAQELERETMVENFWDDAEKSSKKLQLIKQLKESVESYEGLTARLEDTLTLCEMAMEVDDESSVEEVLAEPDVELEEIDYVDEIDEEYINRVARERFGYHIPGEKIYYFGGYGK